MLHQNEAPEIFDNEDIQKNKTMAGLAYIIFFIPLIACPDSAFGKFHANQGLLLMIASVVGSFFLGLVPGLGSFLRFLYSMAMLALVVISLINAFAGKSNELPIIGQYRILK